MPVSAYTVEEQGVLVEQVLAGMAEGKTLKDTVDKLNRSKVTAITPGLVRNWIIGNPEFLARYQATKTVLGQALAEEAVTTARESTSSTTAMDRVLIETLKWAASRMNPAEYGERQTVEHQGGSTLTVVVSEEEARLPAVTPKPVELAVVGGTERTLKLLQAVPINVTQPRPTE